MDPESTPTDADAGPKPDGTNGQEPQEKPSTPEGEKPKTFDEAYVKTLRKEAASARTKLAEAETRLRELEDKDKSEGEKLAARAAESERRATEAEAKLLRVAVAAERKFNAAAIPLLHGDTREEIEASADALVAFAKENEKPAPGFDGGARETPEATKSPEQAHNEMLLRAIGRVP